MTSKPPDPVFVLRGAHYPISSVNFIHPKSLDESIRHLASGTQEGRVLIWDLKIRGTQLEWPAHNSSVLWLKYLDSSNFWTSGRNDSAVLWDINENTAKEKTRFPMTNYLGFSQCDVTCYEDQTLLCVPGPSQENVTLWAVNSGKRICCLTPHDVKVWGCVMQCKWIKCGQVLYILIAYENGTLALWDWPNNKILSNINCNDNPISLEFDSFLMKGICGTASEKVFGFCIEEGTSTIHCDAEFNITNPGLGCVSSRPDSKIYAVGGWDYRVRLFSWKKHKPLAVLMYHKKSIECLAFSQVPVESLSKGYLLAAGSCDNSISLWDIYN